MFCNLRNFQMKNQNMRTMSKHSFNADDDSESVLATVEAVLKDKTEFLNRLIQMHGQAVIQSIMRERQDAFNKLLEKSPPYQAAVKRKAG